MPNFVLPIKQRQQLVIFDLGESAVGGEPVTPTSSDGCMLLYRIRHNTFTKKLEGNTILGKILNYQMEKKVTDSE